MADPATGNGPATTTEVWAQLLAHPECPSGVRRLIDELDRDLASATGLQAPPAPEVRALLEQAWSDLRRVTSRAGQLLAECAQSGTRASAAVASPTRLAGPVKPDRTVGFPDEFLHVTNELLGPYVEQLRSPGLTDRAPALPDLLDTLVPTVNGVDNLLDRFPDVGLLEIGIRPPTVHRPGHDSSGLWQRFPEEMHQSCRKARKLAENLATGSATLLDLLTQLAALDRLLRHVVALTPDGELTLPPDTSHWCLLLAQSLTVIRKVAQSSGAPLVQVGIAPRGRSCSSRAANAGDLDKQWTYQIGPQGKRDSILWPTAIKITVQEDKQQYPQTRAGAVQGVCQEDASFRVTR